MISTTTLQEIQLARRTEYAKLCAAIESAKTAENFELASALEVLSIGHRTIGNGIQSWANELSEYQLDKLCAVIARANILPNEASDRAYTTRSWWTIMYSRLNHVADEAWFQQFTKDQGFTYDDWASILSMINNGPGNYIYGLIAIVRHVLRKVA